MERDVAFAHVRDTHRTADLAGGIVDRDRAHEFEHVRRPKVHGAGEPAVLLHLVAQPAFCPAHAGAFG